MNENEAKHLSHPFYKRSRDYREKIRIGQILKGSEKYPEPFGPELYSAEELLQHAMEENVDQAHYIYGLFEKLALERKIRVDAIKSALIGIQYATDKAKANHDYIAYNACRGAILILEKIIAEETN